MFFLVHISYSLVFSLFAIRTALPEPTHGHLSTQDLHKMIHDGEIDVNPEYQRGVLTFKSVRVKPKYKLIVCADVVWPAEKQCALIESIFLNYYVPPLLFVVTKNKEGEDIRVCMDGKQRLTSVQMFYSGQVKVSLCYVCAEVIMCYSDPLFV